jgi:hypothetical protein
MCNLQNIMARFALASVLCFWLHPSALAADQPPAAPVLAAVPVPVAVQEDTYGTVTWGGLHWGVGVAANFDIQRGSRVVTAVTTPPNNTVRITDSSADVGIGFVLEAHYFFRNEDVTGRCRPRDPWCKQWGHGPFVAIEVGGTSSTPDAKGPITAYALGWMVGIRQPGLTDSHTSSWNFGVGLRVDPKARILGEGIVPNQPLPPGETEIRFKTVARYGLMLLSSFSF